jgi:hypothetical protein
LGKLGSLRSILRKVIMYLVAGPIALAIGGGSILSMLAVFFLAPILKPHFDRVVGGIQGAAGNVAGRIAA